MQSTGSNVTAEGADLSGTFLGDRGKTRVGGVLLISENVRNCNASIGQYSPEWIPLVMAATADIHFTSYKGRNCEEETVCS
ncbi:hypothetical protein MGG_16495 [Pyricularia oryzae 70-15]|uniref:Uncharacterized protein n=1 Tax=Pyricularia oryzae (strain 70-15 / ATCC MYA-4617 / FGSC 8958) TaxID=242507 RepID=G4MQU1_PYRO7|nr:uncharacterized protein MGG_16495 [Pyricularia oryzae 70-15]EHA58172.1 hypothetical protein MGG_16495 [Pyricularia oryzae 70-15]